ncbi:MAG TPA: NUDIX hydrolase [Acidimicrobiales bacterium]|nr:NUDIX hydrolase [Acidimicrobiales bacterium]
MPSPDGSAGGRGAAGPRGFRHLDDLTLLEGWRISLVKATFEAPDGTEFTRDVVRHPGAVAVVPVTEDRRALLVRQYRGPVDRELLEIPAGTRDVEGEDPEQTAHRELMEEAGVSAAHMRLLARVLNSPGFCDEETFVYLATGLEPCASDREGPEERYIEVVEVPLAEVDELVASGRLTDAQTLIGLLLARAVLEPAGHGAGS